jgi:hypothetical protein
MNRSQYLNCNFVSLNRERFDHLDQGAKLAVVIDDNEFAVLELYEGVHPRHRDVRNTDLTLMAPSLELVNGNYHLDWFLKRGFYQN